MSVLFNCNGVAVVWIVVLTFHSNSFSRSYTIAGLDRWTGLVGCRLAQKYVVDLCSKSPKNAAVLQYYTSAMLDILSGILMIMTRNGMAAVLNSSHAAEELMWQQGQQHM